jgi:hypothetical protein
LPALCRPVSGESGYMVEAGGIEPEAIENTKLTTSGQNRSPTGQVESDAGHPPEVATDAERAERSPTGQTESSCGHFSAPTEPPLSTPDLEVIAEAWPKLPGPIKKAMLALVAAVSERARNSEGAVEQGPDVVRNPAP